jgi:integrase
VVEKMRAVERPGPDSTVRAWAERWYAGLGVRDSSRADYRNTLDKYILPTFGHYRVRQLTAHDVEAESRKWAKPVGKLGPNTLLKNLSHFNICLEAARRASLIDRNPIADALKPRGRKPAISPFSAGELVRVIGAATARKDGVFAVMAAMGLRIGEALALDVPDFDAARNTLSVTKTYDTEHGLRPPKSEYSVRTIPVPAVVRPVLVAAVRGRRAGVLFPGSGRKRQADHAVRNRFRTLLKRLKLKYRSPHQLRHSCATVWIAQGIGVGDVARDLGDTVQTVCDTYIHASGASTAAAMDKALLGGGKVAQWAEEIAKRPRKHGKSREPHP